jgi:hypothetical protein
MSSSFIFVGVTGIVHLLVLVSFFYIYLDLPTYKLIISLCFSSLAGVFFVLLFRLLDSISFFIKDRSYFEAYLRLHEVYDRFPAIMFIGTLKNLGFFTANTYYAVYSTQYVFGHISFNYLLELSLYLIILIAICSIIIFLLWHYGLKKYEAFG